MITRVVRLQCAAPDIRFRVFSANGANAEISSADFVQDAMRSAEMLGMAEPEFYLLSRAMAPMVRDPATVFAAAGINYTDSRTIHTALQTTG